MERSNWCKIAVELLYAVKIEGITTGFQCYFLAKEVAFLLKDACSPSRVTTRVWKMPVPGSLKPHKRSESGILPLYAELRANGNMLKTVKLEKENLSDGWSWKYRELIWYQTGRGCPAACLQEPGGRAGLLPVAQVTQHQGGERFENEEGVLQGIKISSGKKGVCVVVRAQGGQARKL